jgi:hypothetical protein
MLVRGQVPEVRNTISPASGSNSRNGSLAPCGAEVEMTANLVRDPAGKQLVQQVFSAWFA